jgi:hypothetical protein
VSYSFPIESSHRLVNYGLWLVLLGMAGCVEPYTPAVIDAPTSFLVVDGFINGNGATRIKLSRTANLTTTTPPPAEKGAKLFVVDDAGQRYTLTEKSSGFYLSDSLQLSAARQYKLRITTVSNATYESDLVPLKITPPIDKLSWQLDGNQVQVQLSTHDQQQQSRYYRWSFIETWEFNSAYQSVLEYDTQRKIIVARTTPIYTCWRTERPTTIRQGSTAQLSQDALTDLSVLTLDGHDERFKVRYSALVNQYTETPVEFAYNELLRKNTEAVGGVNDPLPVQLTGNVHRLDAATEPVLGYVGAHTVQQRRIFISRQDLQVLGSWKFTTPYDACSEVIELVPDPMDKPPIYIPNTNLFNSRDNTPVNYYISAGFTVGYIGSTTACVDCRTRGSNVRPTFW